MSDSLGAEDVALLERAHDLSLSGWGRVHPNPMVGCVLTRGAKIVGEGYHAEYGGPHAEAMALRQAGALSRGSTAYVTLEPCAHWGKTPPCAESLLRAGVKRVVYGAADPGPGKGGGAYLRERHVEVAGPVWDVGRARSHNPSFFHAHCASPSEGPRLPFLALKLAMTLDARIASLPGVRTRITGPEAECEVHRLRTGFDGIMVGAATARTDNPSLTVRLVPPGRTPPARVVIDSLASLDLDAKLLLRVDEAPVHVIATTRADADHVANIRATGAHVHLVPPDEDGRVSLRAALGKLAEEGMSSLLCEGGGVLASELLAGGLAGRLYLFVAPMLMGPEGVPAFPAATGTRLAWAFLQSETGSTCVDSSLSATPADRVLWPAAPPSLFGSDALHVFDIGKEGT